MTLHLQAHHLARQLIHNLPEPLCRVLLKLRPIPPFVPIEELSEKYRQALEMLIAKCGNTEIGDYLEFGVYRGSSMISMYRAATALGLDEMRFIGFDSFEGMPEQAKHEDENAWHPGEFRASLNYATAYLRDHRVDMGRVSLIKGWFEETCNAKTIQAHKLKKASIINIDCDIYSSTKTALEFCRPFMTDDLIIFFDDWNSYELAEKGLGEKKAFEEFLAANAQFSARELKHLSYSKESTAFYVELRT